MSGRVALNNVSITGTIFLEDDESANEDLLETFREINDISVPPELDSKFVNIVEEAPLDSALIISDGLPQSPMIRQGTVELITLSIEDGDLSITVDLSPSLLDAGKRIFDIILDKQDIHVSSFNLSYDIEHQFSDLAISIDGPQELEYQGVKFTKGGHSYIIQAADSAWEPHEGDDSEDDSDDIADACTATVNSIGHFDVSETTEFIDERISEATETVELIDP